MEVNTKASERNSKEWGNFADRYESILENTTMQSSIILYSITRAKDYNRICEVGVGCGLSARMFISNVMKKGAFYFGSDIADQMNQNFEERYRKSDLPLNSDIKYQWIEDSEAVDVQKYADDMGRDVGKKVFHLKADNEKLPYPDQSFDCYLSSLSLNLVNNHKNQLAESYRVLEKGGVAGFTVLGRFEKCNYITFIPEVLSSMGHDIGITDLKHPTHLGDRDLVEKDAKEAGFSSVKTYFTNINILFENDMELFNFMANCPATCHFFDQLDDDQMEDFMVEYKKQYEERFGSKTSDPLEWEILVAIAVK